MEIRALALEGVLELVPRRIEDGRGFFSETYRAESLAKEVPNLTFVQDNHSSSIRPGVLRGLHYQLPPREQNKLVRVIKGAIFDVVVDIRKSSATFGQWLGLEVSATKWNQIFVPKGFAHGFVTLVDGTEVIYKVSDYYSAEHDRSIRFDDPEIRIQWPLEPSEVHLSEKDRLAPLLSEATVFD